MIDLNNVLDAHQNYTKLGFDTVPLAPGEKKCYIKGWPALLPESMWATATPLQNIGLRAGGAIQAAFIDCDDKDVAGTYEKVRQYLVGIGLQEGDYPVIQTASGIGRQIYVRFEGGILGNSRKLAPDIGAGEFKYGPGSLVVAPPSTVEQTQYRIISGNLNQLPVLRLEDVLPILHSQATSEPDTIETPPVRLIHRDMPKDVNALLRELSMAPANQTIGRYRSRSEADAGVVAKLILSGWTYEEISATFYKYGPSKYEELGGKGEDYLERTYKHVLSFLANEPIRTAISENWIATHQLPWPGRSGTLTRNVYLGLQAICWQCNSWTVKASERDLARYVAATRPAVHKALVRLQNVYKLVELVPQEKKDHLEANRYKIYPLIHLPKITTSVFLEKDMIASEGIEIPGVQELWSARLLGRTAQIIYPFLGSEPLSVRAIANQSQKSWSAVNRALGLLRGVKLAVNTGSGWIKGPARLGNVAKHLNTKARATNRQKDLKRETERFVENQHRWMIEHLGNRHLDNETNEPER